MNGQTFSVSYTVQDDKGDVSQTTLPPNSASGSALVDLPSRGIKAVTIRSSTSSWDFFIDNIRLGTSSNVGQPQSQTTAPLLAPTDVADQKPTKPAGSSPD